MPSPTDLTPCLLQLERVSRGGDTDTHEAAVTLSTVSMPAWRSLRTSRHRTTCSANPALTHGGWPAAAHLTAGPQHTCTHTGQMSADCNPADPGSALQHVPHLYSLDRSPTKATLTKCAGLADVTATDGLQATINGRQRLADGCRSCTHVPQPGMHAHAHGASQSNSCQVVSRHTTGDSTCQRTKQGKAQRASAPSECAHLVQKLRLV